MMKIHCMTVGGGNDYVKQGDNHIHVATFLQRFLLDVKCSINMWSAERW